MTNPPVIDELHIGIDHAAPNGDYSAVTLRIGGEIHIIPHPFAEALIPYLATAGEQPEQAGDLQKKRRAWILEESGDCDIGNPEILAAMSGQHVTTHHSSGTPARDALEHLGDVLYMLSDLHPDDQCQAYIDALTFYNTTAPDKQIEPSGIGHTRLINSLNERDGREVRDYLTMIRTSLECRFQASDFVRDGEEGYALASAICVEVMQHIRAIHKIVEDAEATLPIAAGASVDFGMVHNEIYDAIRTSQFLKCDFRKLSDEVFVVIRPYLAAAGADKEDGWRDFPVNKPTVFSKDFECSVPLIFSTHDDTGFYLRLGHYSDGEFFESGDKKKLPWRHTVKQFYEFPVPTPPAKGE